jgi:hypothetical protein
MTAKDCELCIGRVDPNEALYEVSPYQATAQHRDNVYVCAEHLPVTIAWFARQGHSSLVTMTGVRCT